MWVEAVTQAFYSYGVGFGAVTTIGSYNNFKKDCYKYNNKNESYFGNIFQIEFFFKGNA